MEPKSLSLKAVQRTSFDTAFTPVEDSDAATELSLLLSTLGRSLTQCGSDLSSGEWQSLLTWQPGHGLSLERKDSGYLCEQWEHFSGWEDASIVDLREALESSVHLELSTVELRRTANQLPCIRWAGVRHFETSSWTDYRLKEGLNQDDLRKAAKGILQADVLLKENNLPHERMRVDYADGTFWSWTNPEGDYFMAWTNTQATPAMQATLIRCGEAFVLPETL
ncbi:MAG: hypothetical protein AAGA45_04055 [Verrucomicrobiota bacterium]